MCAALRLIGAWPGFAGFGMAEAMLFHGGAIFVTADSVFALVGLAYERPRRMRYFMMRAEVNLLPVFKSPCSSTLLQPELAM